MKPTESSNKIIKFPSNFTKSQIEIKSPNTINAKSMTNVLAITSGKGGVGKTNIVANLGFMLAKLDKKVLIFDADLGLANIDILLGLAPKYNLSHVIMGNKTISEIIMKGPGNINILPASTGIQELTQLTKDQRIDILTQLDSELDTIDIMLIDTAAGISSNVMYFNTAAQEVLVVVTPEPTSMTDAYALMKVMSQKYSQNTFRLLVNLASSRKEAYEIYSQLTLVSNRFLDISIDYLGYILTDENMTRSVRRQKLICDIYPDSDGSKCFRTLAAQICKLSPSKLPESDSNFIWTKLMQNIFEQ